MAPTVGLDAQQLVPTGPDDLVDQLNTCGGRRRIWPWVLGATCLIALLAGSVGLVILVLGALGTLWLVLWERARRTVVAFYDVTGPDAAWFDQLANQWEAATQLGGAWRVQASGDLHNTYQRKVNAGASSLIRRTAAAFYLVPPATFTTNIKVPTVVCGTEALLFLPDRVLVCSGRRWSSVGYEHLDVSASLTRFIEEGAVPRDATVIDHTWRYVNKGGGPDRRFANNRQLPVLLLGELEARTPSGLWWIVNCSRNDVPASLATLLRQRRSRGQLPVAPAPQPLPSAQRPGNEAPSAPRLRQHPPVVPAPALEPRHQDGLEGPPSASPGSRGALFHYAELSARRRSTEAQPQLFAVIDVETTGFDPRQGDRVVEIAIAQVRPDGHIVDEFATIINPDRDPGPEFIHGISADMTTTAPRFVDVAGDILGRLDGCVVVAHNAAFEDRFLAAEFARLGVTMRPLPALCTLWLSREVNVTVNHQLGTLARQAGLPMPDAHAALGDVRMVAALLPDMLSRLRTPLTFKALPASPDEIRSWSARTSPRRVRLQTRAVGLCKGTEGWMASLMARLPHSAELGEGAMAQAYLSSLESVLSDGKIVSDEAQQLAHLAGSAGLGAVQVQALNATFLESMREAAFADDILTAAELRDLRRAASLLGVGNYFDDLSPTVVESTTPIPTALQAPPVVRQRRCGHCSQPGHYRPRCPQLASQPRIR